MRGRGAARSISNELQKVMEHSPVPIWLGESSTVRRHFNAAWLKFTGRSLSESVGTGWLASVHPDDVTALRAISAAQREFVVEYRLKDASGRFRWIKDMTAPSDSDGASLLIGYSIDIEGQKQAEQARRELAERLVTAQEAERTRIARELHDDISQSLMILTFRLERAGMPVSDDPNKRHPGPAELTEEVRDLARRVSKLAHELHSSSLEYLGLTRAVEGCCREFTKQYKIPVDCSCAELPAKLDGMVSLSFLRVAQEALHNIAKHSHASEAEVRLSYTAEEIRLTVRDDGSGFDLEQAQLGGGIGLLSMQERMCLIGGRCEIASARDQGTTIECRAPLKVVA